MQIFSFFIIAQSSSNQFSAQFCFNCGIAMKLKIILTPILLVSLVRAMTSSEDRSLVIIFDATASMHDDLVQLRSSAIEIINNLSVQDENRIKDFILVVFRDPGG
jgi:hypothetical protein